MTKDLDTIQRFIFENADIRGQIVRLDSSLQTIINQHNYPTHISNLLGETLLAATLLASIIKFKGDLTVQYRGDGAVKMLVAKCSHDFHIRGLVQFDATASSETIKHEIGRGYLVVTIQQYDQVKPYQSIIPVNQLNIAHALEKYFAQSEQISTRLVFAVKNQRAAGMLLQLLPEKKSIHDREEFWQHAVKIGETITAEELLDLDNEIILHRLYHSDVVRLFEPQLIIFRCNCTQQKMEDAVKMLGYQDAMALIKEKQKIIVNCEYCNTEFAFDKVDVEAMFL